MTASLFNNQNGAFGDVIDGYVYPQFIGYAMRAPTTQDVYQPGTRWQDNSVSPKVIYETTGAGSWSATNTSGSFTNLTANGTVNLNTTGTGVTTIGTGGTGATNIGNATGGTTFTGPTTLNGKLDISTGASGSVGTTSAMTAGTITVSTTAVTASSIILLTAKTPGGTQGILSVGTITAGTSFVINSSSNTDTSTVSWLIIN